MSIEGKFGNNNKVSTENPEQSKVLEKTGVLDVGEVFAVAKKEASQIIIKPEDRNSEGKLLAVPGGPESHLSEGYWKIVRTESFKKWFGDSDIRDENGEPALVYHTTNSNLDNFDTFSDEEADPIRQRKNIKAEAVLVEKGFYFTAGHYEYGKNRLSVFIKAKVKEIKKHEDIMNLENKDTLRIKKQGYTGLVHTFNHSEDEINDSKKEYRRKYSPRSISQKIFFGFNKLLNTGNYIDSVMERLVDKRPISDRDRVLGKNALQDIKNETRKLNKVKKDAKSAFFEVCVFNSDQIMIVEKEENYKDKI